MGTIEGVDVVADMVRQRGRVAAALVRRPKASQHPSGAYPTESAAKAKSSSPGPPTQRRRRHWGAHGPSTAQVHGEHIRAHGSGPRGCRYGGVVGGGVAAVFGFYLILILPVF